MNSTRVKGVYMANQIEFQQVLSGLKTGQLKYYNLYNADLQIDGVLSSEYYKSHSNDNTDRDQKVSVVFLDIEVWTRNAPNQKFDFKTGDCPLSAITLYSTVSKSFQAFVLLTDQNKAAFGLTPKMTNEEATELVSNMQTDFTKRLKETKHIMEDEPVQIHVFMDEMTMMKACWDWIKQENPLILSGWNSDLFDLPYFYSRIAFISDKQTAAKTMSEFGYCHLDRGLLKIAEYSNMDLLRAYKPRAEGGMNYGRTLQRYSLDAVSDKELKLRKHKFDGDLDTLYETNPIEYLFYNIVDVALCVRLNEKLKHIDLHNGIRRRVKSAFTSAMIGSSALFETFLYYTLLENGKMVRAKMGRESQRAISEEEMSKITLMQTKKGYVKPVPLSAKEFTSLSCKFDGAYVTSSTARMIKGNKLIIDLDAASLYPSMILQHNISFDSFQCRIIPTTCYKLLGYLETVVGKDIHANNAIYGNIYEMCVSYVNREDVASKARNTRDMYYAISNCIDKLFAHGQPMENVYSPKTDADRKVFFEALIPLTNMLNTIHDDRESYNHFIFDYVFGTTDECMKYKKVYVLKHADRSFQYIEPMTPSDALDYLKQYSMTLAGVCFKKHEDGLGIFTEILQNLTVLRAEYRKTSASYPKGSEEFNLWDNRQKAIKVLMNSTYGIYGLSSFRYSNHWLAQAITTQGRLTIKTAQYIADKNVEQCI